jgi:hypothetical protein
MAFASFLSTADFVAAAVVVVTMLIVSFSAYRRTKMRAFACLLGGSLVFIGLAAVLYLYKPASDTSAITLMEWCHVGHFAATVLWGIGFFQLARFARREFERKATANKALQTTSVPPEG